jgi:hypothetical protein
LFFFSQQQPAIKSDKELILRLHEQVAHTTTINLDLTSKLKISEGEIETYKKILVDYQNELSQMKLKQLNEIKSEMFKENDANKLRMYAQANSAAAAATTAQADSPSQM